MKFRFEKIKLLKKILLFVFLFGFVFSNLFITEQNIQAKEIEAIFNDVPLNHKNAQAIYYLVEIGAVKGTSENTFEPEKNINRAAALKMILSSFEVYKAKDNEVLSDEDLEIIKKFSDLKVNEWYSPYLAYALKNGIVKGYNDSTFKPDAAINRAEGLKIVLSIFAPNLPNNFNSSLFSDVKESDWFAKYFVFATEKNIFLPDQNKKIEAGKFLTRSELAEIIYRALMIKKNGWDKYKIWFSWNEKTFAEVSSKFRIPDSWENKVNGNSVVIWKRDNTLKQSTPLLVYPESEIITVSIDSPLMEKDNYFKNIKKVFTTAIKVEEKNNELTIEFEKKIYVFKFINKDKVILIKAEIGDKALENNGFDNLKNIAESHEIVDGNLINLEKEKSALISEINSNIHAENKGMEILKKIPDKKIISTDTIGVGTGPVDYYFSSNLNHTIKYERSFDVILALKQGETDKF